MNRNEGNLSSTAQNANYQVEEQIGYILRKVHQRASSIFESVMAGFDITPMQFTVLIKLDDESEASQNQLGRLAAMDPATTFGVVNRLKKQDLIQQRNDPTDGRRILLSLTAEGQKKASAMRAVAKNVSTQTLEPLAPAEQKILLALLMKLA